VEGRALGISSETAVGPSGEVLSAGRKKINQDSGPGRDPYSTTKRNRKENRRKRSAGLYQNTPEEGEKSRRSALCPSNCTGNGTIPGRRAEHRSRGGTRHTHVTWYARKDTAARLRTYRIRQFPPDEEDEEERPHKTACLESEPPYGTPWGKKGGKAAKERCEITKGGLIKQIKGKEKGEKERQNGIPPLLYIN